MLRRFFFLLSLIHPASAEEIHPAPELADSPLPAIGADFAALVTDRPNSTRIAGFFKSGPLSGINPATDPKAFSKAITDLGKGNETTVTLDIDWLNTSPAPTNFSRTFDPARGFVRSTHNLGTTHLTRTILASAKEGIVFIHFIADKPGDISFRAALKPPGDKGEVRIEDRREITWVSPANPTHKARIWVLPFESDVENDGHSITLRGEGECLLILAHTTAENPAKPLAGALSRLGAAHDPGHTPPDPSKIWQAVSAGIPAP